MKNANFAKAKKLFVKRSMFMDAVITGDFLTIFANGLNAIEMSQIFHPKYRKTSLWGNQQRIFYAVEVKSIITFIINDIQPMRTRLTLITKSIAKQPKEITQDSNHSIYAIMQYKKNIEISHI